jgi:hypothetical protein
MNDPIIWKPIWWLPENIGIPLLFGDMADARPWKVTAVKSHPLLG